MRRSWTLWFLVGLGIVATGCAARPLGQRLADATPVENRVLRFGVPLRAGNLTPAEARDDADTFRYLLKVGYAGFDAANAASEGALERRLDALVERQAQRVDPVAVADFEDELGRALEGTVDSHLSLTGQRTRTFTLHEDYHTSGISVEVQNGSPVVLANAAGVPAGSLFEDDASYLFPVAPPGANRYELGVLSSQELTSAAFRIGGRPVTVGLHRATLGTPDTAPVAARQSPQTVAVAVRSLDTSRTASVEALDRFVELASTSRAAQAVVLDFRDNGGGSDAPWFQFLAKLYDIDPAALMGAVSMQDLESPVTEQGAQSWYQAERRASEIERWLRSWGGRFALTPETRGFRAWSVYKPATGPVRPGTAAFRGRLVVVVNRYSASAAESVVPVARRLGGLVVGENTYGAIGFGNVFPYWLPHSGIRVILAATVFVPPGQESGYRGEGQGYAPEVWVSNREELGQVLHVLTGEAPEFFSTLAPL